MISIYFTKAEWLAAVKSCVNWLSFTILLLFAAPASAASCTWAAPAGTNTYTDFRSEVIGQTTNYQGQPNERTNAYDCGSFTVEETNWISLGKTLQEGAVRQDGKYGILVRASEPFATNPFTGATTTGSYSDIQALVRAYIDEANATGSSSCFSASPIYQPSSEQVWSNTIFVKNGNEEILGNMASQGDSGSIGGKVAIASINVISDYKPGCSSYAYGQKITVTILERLAPVDAINELLLNSSTTYRRICEAPRIMNQGVCELPPGTVDPKKNLGCSGNLDVANPCNAGSGNKHQREDDYVGKGLSPLRFTRTYNSQPSQMHSMGSNWITNLDRSINQIGTTATVQRGDGKQFAFQWSGSTWVGDGDVNGILSGQPGSPYGWTYVDVQNDIYEQFDPSGKLSYTRTNAGDSQFYSYICPILVCKTAGSFRLESVRSQSGRKLLFDYDDDRRLKRMRDPAGGEFHYTYSDVGPTANLKSVTYPDGTVKTYFYAEPDKISAIATVDTSHLLTGINDENDTRFATWKYDDQGRVISSEHGSGAEKVSLAYLPSGKTAVVPKPGVTESYTFVPVAGVIKLSSLSREVSDGMQAGTQFWEYDERGNVIKRTDLSSAVTVYSYDTRNNEISRTEAFGTPLARTIITQWDPTFGKPVKVTRPGLVTTFQLGERASLMKISNASGAAVRTATFTYNELSQPLAATDALNRATKYAYEPNGDLKSVTNALDQITTVLEYDAHGNPTQISDQNGQVTRITYDARQRVVSSNVGGLENKYLYDAAGQLQRLTQPGSVILQYEYDSAHRLIRVSDIEGNSINYGLDDQGNRVRVEVKDATGGLVRRTSQAFDEFNRLKEIKGAN